MASEQFSLCWDNFHKNMSSGLNALLETEELVDVTLAVEGKYLKAHKMVLSVCSPYFKELFKANPCQHPIVFMKDVSYVAISDLLQFMYQGEVQVSQDNLTTFIKTAEALQIKGLTGDGNGSADAESDSTHDVKSTTSSSRQHVDTDYKPRPKKQPAPSPISVPAPISSKAQKRPRLSVSSNDSQSNPPVSSITAKTEPISAIPETNTSSTGGSMQQFKVEPYDQNQSVTIPDDGDDNFGDDTLDDTTVDDTEDYSMMEGEETEPQAGTSADGTGEGQGLNTGKKYRCKACKTTFKTLKQFRSHRASCIRKRQEYRCSYCEYRDISKRNISNHYIDDHGIQITEETLEFDSMDDFKSWKSFLEQETNNRFSSAGYKEYGNENGGICRYACTQTRLGFCPAKIIVQRFKSGRVKVAFCNDHVGH